MWSNHWNQECERCSCILERTVSLIRPRHENMYLRAYADSEDPDQPAHPRSLIRTFAVANGIVGHHQWRTNARMRLGACVEWIWICAFWACSNTFFRSAKIVGIFMFHAQLYLSRKNLQLLVILNLLAEQIFMLSWVEQKQSFITSGPG